MKNIQQEVIKVGIAEMKLVYSPNIIRTMGLGSCVGVIIYDSLLKIAGLAHIMLPSSLIQKDRSQINTAKYADTAVKELLSQLLSAGCHLSHLKAKIAGGAEMFSFSSKNEMMRIGKRNTEAVKKELEQLQIQLVAEDTGGNKGRTIEFNPETSILKIRTVNHEIKEI
ncbi:chemotaxis protein CheD [Heyndrickxia ginsengihumi]|uniref:Probable chemoreceptor glutamine deamidase CheD n=2 Tax=Heyndrickxia ginsengihumi TaxID=363870 RepID=A0A0A6VG12_9BACI|nr:chemotaxis protein CheD [Heyndrickxia ginsengihumi]KHD86521.1 chemotaxis protein CheD [Heyndrickxia ginsengihumi]